MKSTSPTEQDHGRLSVASVIIGVIGCVIITASSVYTALKVGALPWPTIFTSITALVLLRALGHTSLNEANVTQVIMSAGSMVAGGIAFTIPGIWILGVGGEVGWMRMLIVALAGTLLGLVCTALIRKRFVDESDLEYPIGVAAATTLEASEAGGTTGRWLFGSMGFAGIWCVLRDALGVLPTMLFSAPIPGVSFGLYNSPMCLAVGFIVSGLPVAFWFAGSLLGNFGIVWGGSTLGIWDMETALEISQSLGMGLMVGSGIGVITKDIMPQAGAFLGKLGTSEAANASDGDLTRHDAGRLGILTASAVLLICLGVGLSPLTSVILVLLTFVTTIMSAQSVGQTGIDPMETFGLIVLLVVAMLGEESQVRLFFVAAIVAVACGLAGDVMSDFKTGQIIGTDPRTLWVGQAIGAVIGAVVSAVVLATLASAYGTDAFGTGKFFVATQAEVVATMVGGIPNVAAFTLGLVTGILLYVFKLPAMLLGVGFYLPFYISFSAAVGALVRAVYDRVGAGASGGAVAKGDGVAGGAKSGATDDEPTDDLSHEERGTVIASGFLGGESIVGVIIALATVIMGVMS